MPRIKLLSPEVRDKIAAGEVIVRPSSVIKELIENSIDAGAKRIEIEIEAGGKKKCLVNDDGIGMSREDALLSIERYATSKIEKIDDIEKIKTLGFRGEALASIAQVSHLEIETSDGNEGTKILVGGGGEKQVVETYRERGTRIKVSNLFYNLPARLKFLKSDEYEKRLIVDVVKTYALISPQIHFVLNESNRNILNIPEVSDMKMRLMQIFPESIIKKLLPFELSVGSISFSGFISPLGSGEKINLNYIYINARPVKYPRIVRIIAETYQQPKEPPMFLLNINVPAQMLDVNIHPTKNEVKIKEERYVTDLLTQGIRKKIFPTTISKDYTPEKAGFTDSNANVQFVQEFIIPYADDTTQPGSHARDTAEFWQLHNTYIFAQTSTGVIIVDQHVAHERIIYESIINNRVSAQRLLFPITIELTPEEYRIYQQAKGTLESMGIEFKEFSGRTLVIDALPTNSKMTREDLQGFFSEIGSLGRLMNEKKELAKVIACRMAIKAGQKLSSAEMESLIDQLFACENPFICPHGRPIVIKISLDDLGKRFGR
ncbi:MAG: DNA mismatch repair endonuclease MutL [bacterium]